MQKSVRASSKYQQKSQGFTFYWTTVYSGRRQSLLLSLRSPNQLIHAISGQCFNLTMTSASSLTRKWSKFASVSTSSHVNGDGSSHTAGAMYWRLKSAGWSRSLRQNRLYLTQCLLSICVRHFGGPPFPGFIVIITLTLSYNLTLPLANSYIL